MKLKLYKKNSNWHSSVHTGKGGVSSMIAGRSSASIWYCLGVFTFSNLYQAHKGVHAKIDPIRFVGAYQDTRTNNEDFALTPYLFGVALKGDIIKAYGIGICWGYYSYFVGFVLNLPKNYPTYKIWSKPGNQ